MTLKKETANGKKSRRIFSDLIISLLSTVMVSSLLTIGIIYWYLNHSSSIETTNTVETYLTQLGNNLEDPVWNLNTKTISQICDSYMDTHLVGKLKIVDIFDNTVLYERQIPGGKKMMIVEGIVKHNNEDIASIELGFLKDIAAKEIFRTLLAIVILMIVIILVIVGASMISIKYLLQVPLQVLLTGIEEIAAGMYDYQFKRLRHVEFSSITAKFEQMAQRIKDREASLQKSEKWYRLIAENVADIIWTTDMDLKFTYISPAVYQQRGYTVKEAMAQSLNETIHPDSLEKALILFGGKMEFIEAGNPEGWEPAIFEMKQFCKDGTIIYTSNNARILQGPDKQPQGILGVTRDINRQKQAEKEKIKAQKLAGEQKKLALVGQVAGKMAHDFNNILGIIMGNTELSLLNCKDAETRRILELIFEQTIRGKNLTKNLVAFARDQEPKQEFFSVSEKIDLVVNLMRKDLEGIDLIKESKPEIPDLLADPGMIEHALVNLIQNSLHAISMTEHPRIIIRTYCLDNFICFEIEDNGCGIPKEHIQTIYDPSFTLKGNKDLTGSYTTGIKGTGYGMSNVKKYIEQHKGSVFVESKVGSGTKFIISLPIVKKELTDEEKIEIREGLSYFEKNILLVEDETSISEVQYKVLTHEPCRHKVDMADNGQSAMDLFDTNEYDFISLDYILPGDINGMDVYQYVRKTNKSIPILFISGNIEFLESIKELKYNDPYVDHLSKPCQNKDYVDSVNKLLESALGI